MTDRDKQLQQVKKLLALAAQGDTPEGRSAASRAHLMMEALKPRFVFPAGASLIVVADAGKSIRTTLRFEKALLESQRCEWESLVLGMLCFRLSQIRVFVASSAVTLV